MVISKFKKSIIITSSVLTLCIVCVFSIFNPFAKTIIHSDYTIYKSEGLVKEADVIVEGSITDTSIKKIKYLFSPEKTYTNDEDKHIYTVSTMKITKVIKGNLKVGNTIEIKQMGDNKKTIDQEVIDNGGYFKKDSTQIVFLKDFTKFNVPYSVINPQQSVYTVEADGTIKTSPNNKLFTKNDNKNLTESSSKGTQEEQLIQQIKDIVNTTK